MCIFIFLYIFNFFYIDVDWPAADGFAADRTDESARRIYFLPPSARDEPNFSSFILTK